MGGSQAYFSLSQTMDYNLVLDMLNGEPQRTFDDFERLQKKGKEATYAEWFNFENGLDVLLTEFSWKDEEKQKKLEGILEMARQALSSFPVSSCPGPDE